MKKVILVIIVLFLSFIFLSCGSEEEKEPVIKTYILSFYKDSELLKEIEYKENDPVPTYPEVEVEDGFYVSWNKEIPSNITEDMIFTCVINEKQKEYSYIVDGEVMKKVTISYHEEISDPDYKSESYYVPEDGIKAYSYKEEFVKEENNVLYYNHILEKEYQTFTVTFEYGTGANKIIVCEQVIEYGKSVDLSDPLLEDYAWSEIDLSSIKEDTRVSCRKIHETFTIQYFDGSNKLNLEPASYDTGVGCVLPTPQKDGYAFVGWFVSEISLYPFTKISEDDYGNFILRARYVETETHNPITLPNATAHITNIKKVAHSSGNGTYVYQPEIPSGQPSYSSFNWSSSDESIATISKYSTITGKKAGCCIITGTLASDSSVTINCIIRVTGDGITAVTEEEANQITTYTVTFVDHHDNVINVQKVVAGTSAICPIPPVVEGYMFYGWDRVCYNIKEDTTIKARYRRGDNPYQGKRISIIGDSISTFQDYIPSGYSCFYPYPTADVTDVNMTWWMMMVNRLGAGLFINNSYSGSCAASSTGTSASSNTSRLAKLKVGDQMPDVVIIYMGSNDCASKYVDETQFSSGYDDTIIGVRNLCPDAEIILCTLPVSNLYTEENRLAYNEIIRSYGEKYNLKVCELAEIDISNNLVDSAHPKTSGMKIVADKMVEELLK